jgi:geranylgeranyl reductase family protein
MFDVAIVGSGPAGASCATFCADAGLRTLLLERERFPREKVCGDCINPACWPVLERLGVRDAVFDLPHGRLDEVEFIAVSGRSVRLPLPKDRNAEIAVKRSLFDELLMNRACKAGADVRQDAPVTSVTPSDGISQTWKITTSAGQIEAATLVAADGRNSTVARLCKLLPRVAKERVALQTHVPLPNGFGNRVVLQFVPEGYSGQAPVGCGQLNVCLVASAKQMPALRRWAEARFGIDREHSWRTITPLTRAALPAARNGLFLIGDAARVVEPFTGEGIYYALRSGELAAEALTRLSRGADAAKVAGDYIAAHRAMYRGRLWVNRLARAAVLSPRISSFVLEAARFQPALLRLLTAKVVTSNAGRERARL